MLRRWRRPAAPRAARLAMAAMVLGTLLNAGPAATRPLQVEDLLQQESFGAVILAPGGRWLHV